MDVTVFSQILKKISPSEWKQMRLVCKQWKQLVGQCVVKVSPQVPDIKCLKGSFPGAQIIDFSSCLLVSQMSSSYSRFYGN